MTMQAAVEPLEAVTSVVAEALAPYETIDAIPAGRTLFREGAEPNGVYYLHSGAIDMCFASPRSGETKSLLIAQPGQILGLTSIVSGRPHDCTATTRTPVITGFVDRQRFLRLLDEQPALWLTVLRLISSNINDCWDCMRSLAGLH